MRIRYVTFAIAALAAGGLGFEASAQQKTPTTAARAASGRSVVVYKSPT